MNHVLRFDVDLLGEQDFHLFNEGTHRHAWRVFGSHPAEAPNGVPGVHFAVWAPNARSVALMGDFNGWRKDSHHLAQHGESGIWRGFVEGLRPGAHYKYHVVGPDGRGTDRADPYAFRQEHPPATGSQVWELDYDWQDADWMAQRGERAPLTSPLSIYEVHVGSWRRRYQEQGRWLYYRELAHELADHALAMGFTHVELLPVMEHPFYGSWGYQVTGFFAPTARYGTPQDLMYLVDHLHQRGLGVILDWVPSHFPDDGHGLVHFDGTHLYEHADPRQGLQPEWNTQIFNYGRHEVRSFLVSNALYWLEVFHADGLRVDAVASMLHLDYGRKAGEWQPNRHGGRENLEAVEFIRQLNDAVQEEQPHALMMAEESTTWPGVTRPTHLGGLGFTFKWDMGYMHDTLDYLAFDPVFRKFHHDKVTFRMMYAYAEKFVLPFSHDEVVHGKYSLWGRMNGDEWRRFAQLRLMLAWTWLMPGKKLLFMGGEFGQRREWAHDDGLDWHLLQTDPRHEGVAHCVADLNRLLQETPALHAKDHDPTGFRWSDCHDADASVLSLLRFGGPEDEAILGVFNFTPLPRIEYRVAVPWAGTWTERLNTDAAVYGGTGRGNQGEVEAEDVELHGQPCSLRLVVPPLAAVVLSGEPRRRRGP